MQRQFDVSGARLTDAAFAMAYRATIPVLADAKHVTIRMCEAREQELSRDALDISEVVEVGMAKDGKVRAVAVPVSVHVDDGAEVIVDNKLDPTLVNFEVNGLVEVQIKNIGLTDTERAALAKIEADRKAMEEKNAAIAQDADLKAKIEAAKQAGREEALLEKAKLEGRAEVEGKPEEPKPTLQ